MRDPFTFVKERVGEFGNHFNKYLLLISRNRESLINDLEKKGVLNNVYLYKPAIDLHYEMDTIVSVTDDRTKQLDYLATYYALQYLNLNIRCLDVLRMSLLTEKSNLDAYRNFMKQVGKGFQKLTGCYMEKILGLHFSDKELGEFVVIGVGTRADQDDIDIGIIDKGGQSRSNLNFGIGRVVQEMMKRACYLHLHISEHVGTESYSASIHEYIHLLDKEIQDFVTINEMFNAWPIFGSKKLFDKFQQKVIRRYHYHEGEEKCYHEGFLRGILGEILSLRSLSLKDDRLHPKEDALRMIKGMMSVSKTIFNIQESDMWGVISILKKEAHGRQAQFYALEESLLFIETFRFLYQLLVCQSEDIYLQDRNDWKNLNIVAKNMGYRNMGVLKAWNHLLIAYYQFVQQANEAIDELLPWVRDHLTRNSYISETLTSYTEILENSFNNPESVSSEDRLGRISELFAQKLRFFRGTQFWDDILNIFMKDDGRIMKIFIEDLKRMPENKRQKLLRHYAACGNYTSRTVISLLVFLASKAVQWDFKPIFSEFCVEFLKIFEQLPNADEKLTKIAKYQPALINEFFHLLPDDHVSFLISILKTKHWDDNVRRSKERLIRLLSLHKISSKHFYRFLMNMTKKNPELVKFLDKSEKIHMMSLGNLGKVEDAVTFKEKKEILGNYYDMEFVRVGILTMLGENIESTNIQYTEFVDNYFQVLFSLCKRELDEELGKRTFTKDLFAIFSAGGHAREQAFDNDYDIIVLLNSQDKEIMDYCMRVVSKMNSEIVKRGTLPHFRFADHFGRYVTTFNELKGFLEQDIEELFVDKSQLLGCRRVVGSKIFSESFLREIIVPYIFKERKKFIIDMVTEFHARHENDEDDREYYIDVKDCMGGLRDIEMVLMIYKAFYKIKKNISNALFDMLSIADTTNDKNIKRLHKTYNLLCNVRNFYRLTVAADDRVVWEEVEEPIKIMKSANIKHKFLNIDKLRNKVIKATIGSSQILESLMDQYSKKAKKL